MIHRRVACEACTGLGHRALTDTEARTLAAIGDAWVPTVEIERRL